MLNTEMSRTQVFYFWVYTLWNLSPELNCTVALTESFQSQIFLHFGQFHFYSRQVVIKVGELKSHHRQHYC